MSLFRGIAYIILGDKAFTGYPTDFAYFGQGLCLVGVFLRIRAVRACRPALRPSFSI